jgi:fructosamine-3-kinase
LHDDPKAADMSLHPTDEVGLSFDLLRDVLRHIVGNRTEVAAVNLLRRQNDYRVLRVGLRFPPQTVIVKVAGAGSARLVSFARTASLHRLVRDRTTVPVPDVLAADDSCTLWPWRYCVLGIMPGQEWAAIETQVTTLDRADAHRQIGDAVGQLHSIQLPAFGEEVAASGAAAGARPWSEEHGIDGPDWRVALAARAARMIARPVVRDIFMTVLDERAERLAGVQSAALCHDDLHRHNLLFDRSSGRWLLSAVLDFDKAWAGDPESDLARLELWRGMTSPEFWAAYGEHRTVSAEYPARRSLYQFLWCLEYGRSTPQHLEDTRQVCGALGLSVGQTVRILNVLADGRT